MVQHFPESHLYPLESQGWGRTYPAAIGYIYIIYILYRLLCFLHLVASCCILLHMISADPAMDSCRRPCSVWRESALSLGLSRDCGNPLEDLARRILSLKFQAFFVSLWSSLIVFICPNWCQGFGKEGCRQVDDLHSQNMQMMKHPANFLRAIFDIFSARQIRRLTVPASYIQNRSTLSPRHAPSLPSELRFCQAKVCRPRRRKGRGLGAIWAKHVKNQ